MGFVSNAIFNPSVRAPSAAEEAALCADSSETDVRLGPQTHSYLQQRARRLKNHLLLEENDKNPPLIAMFETGQGVLSHHMAHFYPRAKITAFVPSQTLLDQIDRAAIPENLDYVLFNDDDFKSHLFDAVVLPGIFQARHSKNDIDNFLAYCLRALKPDGYLLIEQSLTPDTDASVILELDDQKKDGNDCTLFEDFVDTLSDADIDLITEQVMDRPHTRAFLLPARLAYEFVLQQPLLKQGNKSGEMIDLPHRTACTAEALEQSLIKQGGRVMYLSPLGFLRQEPSFKLYHLFSEDGARLGAFPSCHLFVVQKVAAAQSLKLGEKQVERFASESLNVRRVRDENSGHILDIVESDSARVVDIIPYRQTSSGGVNVFLTQNVPRCLSNVLTPTIENLDGRRWSGHMVEAITLDKETTEQAALLLSAAKTRQYLFDETGLIPQAGARLKDGPALYPAPDLIDERRASYYVPIVSDPETALLKTLKARSEIEFDALPTIRELDVHQVLEAIHCGLIPNARLEVQLNALLEHIGQTSGRADQCHIPVDSKQPEKIWSIYEIEAELEKPAVDFDALDDQDAEDDEGRAGKVSAVRSRFCGEGVVQDKLADMAVQEKDFVMFEEGTQNTAVILPLTRDLSGEVLAGMQMRHLPIPQRHSGQSGIITAPSMPLPADITNMEQAAAYIAEFFNVTPDRVAPLGQSYFNYIDLTPHRIYPFAVASAGVGAGGAVGGMTSFAPIKDLWMLNYQDQNFSFLLISAMAHLRIHDSDLEMGTSFGQKFAGDHQKDGASCPSCFADLFLK
jgi:SAM-dependent methyltransferase